MDLAAVGFGEAWDRNEAREWLSGFVVGADGHAWRGFSIRGEVVLLRVGQQGEDAWLRGITFGTRTRAKRTFLDVAVGVSDATRAVPIRGTRFNYLALIGAGAEIPVGRVQFILSGRWLHVSNSGRESRHLNPDIQALGAIVGVGWSKGG